MIAERLVRIGADPSDDDETRLDKLLVLSAVATPEAVGCRRPTAKPALRVKGKAEPVEAFVLEALT